MTDVIYDIGGPSDIAELGDPIRIIPANVPRAARNHNYLLEVKADRDTDSWERGRGAYRWSPELEDVA